MDFHYLIPVLGKDLNMLCAVLIEEEEQANCSYLMLSVHFCRSRYNLYHLVPFPFLLQCFSANEVSLNHGHSFIVDKERSCGDFKHSDNVHIASL